MPKMKVNIGTASAPNWIALDANNADTLGGVPLSAIDERGEGPDSHAEGYETRAVANNSHAEGSYTIAYPIEWIRKVTSDQGSTVLLDSLLGITTSNATNEYAIMTEHNMIYEIVITAVDTVNNSITFTSETLDTTELKTYVIRKKATNNVYSSHAEGAGTIAGAEAHAEGSSTIAAGTSSHSEGEYTKAFADGSHAEGYMTEASGKYSHAEGKGTKATKTGAHAEGSTTTASGSNAHAEGYGTEALAINSHAEGRETKAAAYKNVQKILSFNNTNKTITFGYFSINAITAGSKVGVWREKWGIPYHTEYSVTVVDSSSFTITLDTTETIDETWLYCLFTMTTDDTDQGGGVHAEGSYNLALAEHSHAEGSYNVALGQSSHAEGSYNKATGGNGHVEGSYSEARGSSAHAEGQQTLASGESSHAEGKLTVAGGAYSHAEGDRSIATGNSSHVEGLQTKANALGNHAEGIFTHALRGEFYEVLSSTTTSMTLDTVFGLAVGNMVHVYSSLMSGAPIESKVLTISGTTITIDTPFSNFAGVLKAVFKPVAPPPGNIVGSHAEGFLTIAVQTGSHSEGSGSVALGGGAHAEGSQTLAKGSNSHAEGSLTKAQTMNSHSEGHGTAVNVTSSFMLTPFRNTAILGTAALTVLGGHAEGVDTIVQGAGAHAEGLSTGATGVASHSEGYRTIAGGTYAHAEGNGTSAGGTAGHAEGVSSSASGYAAHAQNEGTLASGSAAHAEGFGTKATGHYSHAEGLKSEAISAHSHAEGWGCRANATNIYTLTPLRNTDINGTTSTAIYSAHAEGADTLATGSAAHAQGLANSASGIASHAGGFNSIASGTCSTAQGDTTLASATNSVAFGFGSQALGFGQLVSGLYNSNNANTPNGYSATTELFILGNGTAAARGNAFKVFGNGQTYADAAYYSTGADYAEYFEWADGNSEQEDRVGYFVTIEGEFIRKATSKDEYILGIISATPSVVGDDSQAWKDKYLKDEWGRIQYEWVDIPEESHIGIVINEEGEEEEQKIVTREARREYRQKINPDWNPDQEYQTRQDRPEFDAVGMMGKLLVRDNGEVRPNEYVRPNDEGIAVRSSSGYRVIKRVSKNIIQVVLK